MSFADRLDRALAEVRHPALLGLDPHLELLPAEHAVARNPEAPPQERAAAVEAFCRELIDLAAGRVAAVKPQSAFFEILGADGVRAWENVVAHAHAHGLLVIGDVKRADIGSTAAAYASAFLEGAGAPATRCDAITVNPYLGPESLEPFVVACRHTGAGIFVLVRTSNPGASLLQLHGSPPLCELVAREVRAMGEKLMGEHGMSSIGAVVGATHPAELQRMRELMPRTPFLLPGYGAQGATARDVVHAFPHSERRWRGGLVNSSRGIAFAWRQPKNAGRSWKDSASDALDTMIADLREALGIHA